MARTNRPNIIFIMSDDHAAHAMSCYNSRVNKTPNLDRIADEGMRLENCFCTNSICTPSRATILTGKYSHINGAITFNPPDPVHATFPQILRNAGYYTAIVGKWHLLTEPAGFDYWNVLPGQGKYFDPDFIEMGRNKAYQGYVTDITMDISLDILRNRPEGQPFCLLCHNRAPHDPWSSDKKHAHLFENEDIPEPLNLFDDYATRSEAIKASKQVIGVGGHTTYEERTGHIKDPVERKKAQYQIYMKSYLRCVASIDDNAGRILDYLDETGLADNTIVIYTSDQGFFLGDHGWYDKRFMYEESLRMPFIVRYPDKIKAHGIDEHLIANIDFAPLFLDYAGIPVPDDMQGHSFRHFLEDSEAPCWRESVYYRYYYSHFGTPAHWGLRTQTHKLIYYHDSDEWELYDLIEDPMEMKGEFRP
ncbi:unnamed protein product, partial [marine sediment metagenome]